jgi:hypothetical protein
MVFEVVLAYVAPHQHPRCHSGWLISGVGGGTVVGGQRRELPHSHGEWRRELLPPTRRQWGELLPHRWTDDSTWGRCRKGH